MSSSAVRLCLCCQAKTRNKKYCSVRCSNIAQPRRKRERDPIACAECEAPTYNAKYCCVSCQQDQQRRIVIAEWLAGDRDGGPHYAVIKQYLRQTRGDRCELCGWSSVHPLTGRVPVQMDHIDGNWQNNRCENLRLLCPNCHSLTDTFGSLNKGKVSLSRRAAGVM